MQQGSILSESRKREAEYNRQHLSRQKQINYQPVALDIIAKGPRRPWNPYWSMYDRVLAADIAGKRILVPGCGYGEDAIRLAQLGAEVYGCDISAEAIDIALTRAYRARCCIDFRVMAAEAMDYPTDFFDGVVLVDILHHVDIAATMAEIARVVAPGGLIIGNERYTHSAVQRIRESALVTNLAYPLMRPWIYDGIVPSIAADQRKFDQRELTDVLAAITAPAVEYFGMTEGRLYPTRMTWPTRVDKMIMNWASGIADKLASRVVFSGRIGSARLSVIERVQAYVAENWVGEAPSLIGGASVPAVMVAQDRPAGDRLGDAPAAIGSALVSAAEDAQDRLADDRNADAPSAPQGRRRSLATIARTARG